MSIAIMGAGAIGSVIGGMLARQGHRVTLVGRKSHMDAISQSGLHISGIWGEHTVLNLNAVTSPPHKYMDIVFLTVKSFDTAAAARDVLSMIGADTMVVSMQNGLGNVETLAGIAGRDRTIGAVAIFGAIIPEPGRVEVTVIASETLVGEMDGPPTPRVEAIAGMLDNAGIPTKTSVNIMRDIWHKALYNIALNPLSALLEVPYGDIADNPDTRWLIKKMVSEAFKVAGACGVDLGLESPEEYLKILWDQKLPPTRSIGRRCFRIYCGGRGPRLTLSMGQLCGWGRSMGLGRPIILRWCG